MEVGAMGALQANAAAAEVFPARRDAAVPVRLGFARGRRAGGVCFPRKGFGGGVRRSAAAAAVRAEVNSAVVEKNAAGSPRSPTRRRPELFVGLPLDAITGGSTVNNSKAIAAGLRALKLLGADGVELPVWWGVVENDAMGEYDWSGYLSLVRMIQDADLRIRASLHLHASKAAEIPLPSWVSRVGDADPDIYFADREGRRHRECLSLAVDDLPVLCGRSAVQVYEDFFRAFRTSFSEFVGSTITDISIGLGPGGELRYPSSTLRGRNQESTGVGEFQCYDKHMLRKLKETADGSGNHLWGLTGPHDAPRYEETPDTGSFFREQGGSWETPYGDFFLTWYSSQLLSHCDRLLSMASVVLGDLPVRISGKIPLMHPWYNTRSHPSELTAGFYNTDRRDGYDTVAEVFAKNSCRMIVTGLELSNDGQVQECRCCPESLVSQIRSACKRHGVRVFGENSSKSKAPQVLAKIKDTMLDRESWLETFTYQRMGAFFFSPEHWPGFTEFVRNLDRPELHADDLASDGDGGISLRHDDVHLDGSSNARQMQTA